MTKKASNCCCKLQLTFIIQLKKESLWPMSYDLSIQLMNWNVHCNKIKSCLSKDHTDSYLYNVVDWAQNLIHFARIQFSLSTSQSVCFWFSWLRFKWKLNMALDMAAGCSMNRPTSKMLNWFFLFSFFSSFFSCILPLNRYGLRMAKKAWYNCSNDGETKRHSLRERTSKKGLVKFTFIF